MASFAEVQERKRERKAQRCCVKLLFFYERTVMMFFVHINIIHAHSGETNLAL
jgi:hypothetical protein